MAVNVLENLVTYYRENKISHAYLIETNNLEKCYEDLKEVIKQIVCQNEFAEGCTKCNLCSLIDQGYLPSLIVVEPTVNTIKKEQVLELKRNFSSMPVYTKDNIYVIKRAEKLTDASANTMLKFVEEPEENIIGFFLTNNINNVISTIRSRCEVLKVNYEIDEFNVNSLENEEFKKHVDVAKKYLNKLEVEKSGMIMYNKDVLLSEFSEREDIRIIFNILLVFYQEYLSKLLGQKHTINFDEWKVNFADMNDLIHRIDLVVKFLDDLDSNANLELLLDRFVVELSDNNV